MIYRIRFTPSFEKQLKEIKEKDSKLFSKLIKRIAQISDKPGHYKHLSGVLAGMRRAHMGPFVVIFETKGDPIIFHYIKHHDKAY